MLYLIVYVVVNKNIWVFINGDAKCLLFHKLKNTSLIGQTRSFGSSLAESN